MERTKAEAIFEKVRGNLSWSWIRYQICGSFRRGRAQVKDLDVLVIGDYVQTYNAVVAEGWPIVVGQPDSKQHILRFMVGGLLIDLMFVTEEVWGTAAMHHTGPVEVNIIQRARAKKRGMSLNQFGLWKGEEKIASKTEEEVYKALEIEYMTPEEREIAGNDIKARQSNPRI